MSVGSGIPRSSSPGDSVHLHPSGKPPVDKKTDPSPKTGLMARLKRLFGMGPPSRVAPTVRQPKPTDVRVPKKTVARAKELRKAQSDINRDCAKLLRRETGVDGAKVGNRLLMNAAEAKSLALDVAAAALGEEKSALENNFPGSVDLKRLTAAERQLFTELAGVHGKNKTLGEQLANLRDGVTATTIGSSLRGIRARYDALKSETDEGVVAGQLKTEILGGLKPPDMPKTVEPGDSAQSARQRAMDSIAYKFDQKLRFDTKTRILAGTNATAMNRAIDDMVGELDLTPKEKSQFADRMKKLVAHRLPNPSSGLVITQELGHGGMGKIFAATFQGREVVVKQNLSQGVPKHFDVRHEMIMHDSLVDNPNAPKLLGAYTEQVGGGTSTTIVMEKVKGPDLFQLIGVLKYGEDLKTTRPYYTGVTAEDRAKVGRHLIGGAVKALKPMHDLGITHLDIKPGNIMLDTTTMESRLIDFGSAAHRDVVEKYSALPTTPIYYQGVNGSWNHADTAKEADVFALGASLADMIVPIQSRTTGVNPYVPSFVPVTGTRDNPAHPDWSKPELREIRGAIDLMCSQDPRARPTMEQLQDAAEGRLPKLAGPGESGVKTAEQAKLLLRAFDPNGQYGGGREVLMGLVK